MMNGIDSTIETITFSLTTYHFAVTSMKYLKKKQKCFVAKWSRWDADRFRIVNEFEHEKGTRIQVTDQKKNVSNVGNTKLYGLWISRIEWWTLVSFSTSTQNGFVVYINSRLMFVSWDNSHTVALLLPFLQSHFFPFFE